MSVNIKNTDDDFCRYKMPHILTKVEGRGNGIKTVVSNISEVAKALGHPPIYPTKFMAYELGASTVYDDKNDRYIIRGAHTAEKLQSLLKIFIAKFVLCDQCENPETSLKTLGNKKNPILTKNCKACGHSGKIESANRLMAFVLKNHSQYSTGPVPSAESHVNETVQNASAVDEPPAESIKTRVNALFKFVKKMIDSGTDVTQNDLTILREAESLEVRKEAPYVLVELLFDADILQQISSYRNVFLRICYEMKSAQKSLISALVQFIIDQKLIPSSAHILKKMYDSDILEEQVLVEWFQKTTKKGRFSEITDVVSPFIQWLIDAEEETDEDDDDGVIISVSGVAGIQIVTKKPEVEECADESESDGDINIDEI